MEDQLKRSMGELNRLSVQDFKGADKLPVTIVLDNVRSMHNVGSIFRTADAFLIEKIMLCGITAKPPHREITKTALGATESLEWHYSETTLNVLTNLRSAGYKIFAIEQVKDSLMLDKVTFDKTQKIALVFGNEVFGVEEEILKNCDGSIEIPQFGTKHSFNITISVGIVLWHYFMNRL